MSDIRDFGATGDGATDDTDPIQHAVDQGDGVVHFRRGAYRLSRPVVVRLDRVGPTALLGDGGTARLLMDGEGPALHVIGNHAGTADPKSVTPAVRDRERLPTIAGLAIDGRHPQAVGIRLEGTLQATLTGLLIRRCRYGVHLVRRNRNLLLADSHIFDGGPGTVGVFLDGVNLHQAIIVGCHVSYCGHAGIKVADSEVRNLQITGCDIEYNHDPDRPDSADVWIDARNGTIREGTIASNTIQAKPSPGGANVRIEGPPLDDSRGAGLWTIAGNILQDQTYNLLLRSCRGVSVTGNSFAVAFGRSLLIDKCRHIAVGTNTFDHNPDYVGDHVDGIAVRDSAAVSLANLILESTRAGGPDRGAAIEVTNSREVSIQGCQVLDPAHRGIELVDVRNSRVADCTVLDRRDAPTMRQAIRLVGSCRDNLVSHNLTGGATVAHLAIGDGTATVAGNVRVGQGGGG